MFLHTMARPDRGREREKTFVATAFEKLPGMLAWTVLSSADRQPIGGAGGELPTLRVALGSSLSLPSAPPPCPSLGCCLSKLGRLANHCADGCGSTVHCATLFSLSLVVADGSMEDCGSLGVDEAVGGIVGTVPFFLSVSHTTYFVHRC